MATKRLPPPPAPELDYITERQKEIVDHFKTEDEAIDDLRSIREQKKAIPLATELRLIDTPLRDFSTISDEIQRVAATLSIHYPKLQVTPVNETDKAQKNATLREKWSLEVLREAGRRDPEKETFPALVDALVGDGGACTKVVYMPDIWQERNRLKLRQFEDDEGYHPDPIKRKKGTLSQKDRYLEAVEEYKRGAGPPIGWYSVDIRQVYPVYSGGKLAEVFEIQERPASAVFRQYQLGRDAQGDIVPDELGQPIPAAELKKNAVKTVTVIEHWSEWWCFPAETLVASQSDLVGASKRWYQGDLAEIRTASGHQLAGTPNHTVLTQRGWVALGEVQVGDRVVCRLRREGNAGRGPDVEHAEALIGEVFDALADAGQTHWARTSPPDFHGDGQDGEVEIVGAHGELPYWLHAAFPQPPLKDEFARADAAGVVAGGRSGGPDTTVARRAAAPQRGALSGTLERSLFVSTSAQPQASGFRIAAPRNPCPLEDALHHGLRRTQTAGDVVHALQPIDVVPHNLGVIDAEALPALLGADSADHAPQLDALGPEGDTRQHQAVGNTPAAQASSAFDLAERLALYGVAFDEVIGVNRKPWAGHVYNLQTGSNWFFANSIIAHNCSTLICSSNYSGAVTTYVPRNDRDQLLQWPHGLGVVPYVFSQALRPNYFSGRKTGWGVAHSKVGLVLMKAFLLVVFANLAARDTMAPLQRVVVDPSIPLRGKDGTPKGPESIKWGLGDLFENEPNTEIRPIQFPQMPYLDKFWALISQEIQNLESARINPNIGSGVEGAGFAINQLLSESRIRHDPIAQAAELHIERVIRLFWRIVRLKIRDTVWVHEGASQTKRGEGWLAAGPDDLSDAVKLTVTLDPERASSKLIDQRMYTEMVKSGFISLDQARERLGENPDEVRLGRAMDRLREASWYVALQDKEVFEEFAKGDQQWERAAQEILALIGQQGSQAGTGGVPGMAVPGGVPGGMPGGVPPAMGSNLVPDMGALALSPNGAGVVGGPGGPLYGPPTPQGPVNGSVSGAGAGAVVPEQAAAAGMGMVA